MSRASCFRYDLPHKYWIWEEYSPSGTRHFEVSIKSPRVTWVWIKEYQAPKYQYRIGRHVSVTARNQTEALVIAKKRWG